MVLPKTGEISYVKRATADYFLKGRSERQKIIYNIGTYSNKDKCQRKIANRIRAMNEMKDVGNNNSYAKC